MVRSMRVSARAQAVDCKPFTLQQVMSLSRFHRALGVTTTSLGKDERSSSDATAAKKRHLTRKSSGNARSYVMGATKNDDEEVDAKAGVAVAL
jgi:hypothetical protein